MDNRDWEQWGRTLRKAIEDAVQYANKNIINQNMGGTGNTGRNADAGAQRSNAGGQWAADARRQEVVRYKAKPTSKALAILLAVLGYGLGAVVLLWGLLILAATVMLDYMSFGLALTVFNALLLGGCGFMAYKGTATLIRLKRFKAYVQEIGSDVYCNISRLAKKVGKSPGFVVKDVERMIANGWFIQGHLDDKRTCLMVTDQMYSQYRQLEQQRQQQVRDEAEQAEKKRIQDARRAQEERRVQKEQQVREKQRRTEERQAKQNHNTYRSGLAPEVLKVIQQGDEYVKKIRRCNDAIPGEVISGKIHHMEMLVDRIFDRVEQNPACVGDIRKLMEYYLPTTVKLLETYAEMDAQPYGGENIQTAKREIEETLDTINGAFEKLLDSMFQETAWDVSSDISVLKTMLAQEGLHEDGLRR